MSEVVEPAILPVKVVAAKLSRSVRTILRMSDRGEFPKLVRVGGQNYIVASEYDAWFRNLVTSR